MTKRKPGRPRSEKSREAILSATHQLLQEKGGQALTIEAIAKRAEVGKPTIYRWWPSLADIVLEVLQHQASKEILTPKSESLEKALRQFLWQSVKVINAGSGTHLRFLMAQAQLDEEFRTRFRDNLVERRRDVLRSIFQDAIDRGEMDSDQNLDILVDMIFGAMWYRLLVGHRSMNRSFADDLTHAILRSMKGVLT